MKIQVTQVGEVTSKKDKNGKNYKMVEIMFISQGRAGKYTISSYSKAFAPVLAAQEGEEFEITTKQNGEYVNWDTAESLGIPAKTESEGPATGDRKASTSSAPYKSTYETPEERAKKQVCITRSASVKSAIAYFTMLASDVTSGTSVQDVLDVAKHFEGYILGNMELNNDTEIE